jgi:hypothetical protein
LAQHPTTFTGPKKFLVAMIPVAALGGWLYYLWFVSAVLPSVEKYSDQSIKAEGYVERVRLGEYRRTGHWVTFHPNGKKESEGRYAEGKMIGTWEFWSKEGEAMPPVAYANNGQPASPASQKHP